MALTGRHTYVGFGFGAIQAGLFLYEAFRSGHFARLVVAEVVPEAVDEVRRAGGEYRLNIAHTDRIETVGIRPVEVYNPNVAEDRERLIEALAEAHEIGTAVPSVAFYATKGPGSLHRVLAAGLARQIERTDAQAVVYAAENHNAAAEILEEHVLGTIPEARRPAVRRRVQFLNTVIGKMSGVVPEPAPSPLATITPRGRRAFLVEAFNRILISKIHLPSFECGIDVFDEKDDLLPFEEAKLFGHNATHALGTYLGRLMGLEKMADLRCAAGVMGFLREAFLKESGESLLRKHRGADRLFTPEGYADYAADLLARMTNPFLADTVERVGRDPERKLGWDDRLVGTMRLALGQGLTPRRYAIGAAAALAAIDAGFLKGSGPTAAAVEPLWAAAKPDPEERKTVLGLIEEGRRFLGRWSESGFPDLRKFFGEPR
jgi:mannitol-1-phosphate 5-dehydrogenase